MPEEKTFEEQLQERAKESIAKQYIPLDATPDEMQLKWISDEFKEDANKNECLFVRFESEIEIEGSTHIQQKYTATMFQHLKETIEAIGTKDDLTKKFFLYRKEDAGRARQGARAFPRFYPVPQEKRKKTS